MVCLYYLVDNSSTFISVKKTTTTRNIIQKTHIFTEERTGRPERPESSPSL